MRAAAEKALELSPDSAEAHTSLANYKSWYEHDWAGADKEFREAVARGVGKTPTVLVDGEPFIESFSFKDIAASLDRATKGK